jgi:mRNA-degrading endonuclease YafQ of YafQ-DinJ toxin-antitoxin module
MYESLKRLQTFKVRNATEISNFTISTKLSTVIRSLTGKFGAHWQAHGLTGKFHAHWQAHGLAELPASC